MITVEPHAITAALRHWRARQIMPTGLSSQELAELGREVHLRSVFSARMTNAEAVQELSNVVDELLQGKINISTGILKMYEKLKSLGYDPATGFPEDYPKIPMAERGTICDLSSAGRLKLMLQTNLRMAMGFGRMTEGNSEYRRREYPAWELVRVYPRVIPRGSPKSESEGWYERWAQAGQSVGWAGAIDGPMMALKDSPIWMALGSRELFADGLGNPYWPFAFGSGMGWREIARAEAMREGLIDGGQVPAKTTASLAPGEDEIVQAFDRLSPEYQQQVREWVTSVTSKAA
ncbi:MAG TPA: hypothetical protein VHY22_13480 [Chthoniobacteraceae bacterium]|jgi:hypothetical protein|nr:hypothetical protein [Chthoniobacteraceae bacterium]